MSSVASICSLASVSCAVSSSAEASSAFSFVVSSPLSPVSFSSFFPPFSCPLFSFSLFKLSGLSTFPSSFFVSVVFSVAFVDSSSFCVPSSCLPFSLLFASDPSSFPEEVSVSSILFDACSVCVAFTSLSARTKNCCPSISDNSNISASMHDRIRFTFFHILHSPYFLFLLKYPLFFTKRTAK